MEEAAKAVAGLVELDLAMYRPQTDRARGLGFVMDAPDDEVCKLLSIVWREHIFPRGTRSCCVTYPVST